jgi:hypothetical protein
MLRWWVVAELLLCFDYDIYGFLHSELPSPLLSLSLSHAPEDLVNVLWLIQRLGLW